MKTKTILKKLAVLVSMLTVLVSIDGIGYAMMLGEARQRREQGPQYTPSEVLVKFKEGADPSSILRQAGIEAKEINRIHSITPAIVKFKKDYKLEKDSEGWYPFLGKQYKEVSEIPDDEVFKEAYKNMPEVEKGLYRAYKLKLPEGTSVEEVVSTLNNNPNVEYAEPNRIVKIQMVPNDTYYSSNGSWGQGYDDLWGIKKIQCEQAMDISQGEGVVVAVIDTGVDYNHPDFFRDENGNGQLDPGEQYNIWTNEDEILGNGIDDDRNGYVDDVYGYDFAYNDGDPRDGYGHGTHVAGTIAAVGNNNIGVIGVAPRAKIMAVKGLNDEGSGYDADLADAVKYATDNGAKILSNSWGGLGISQTLTAIFHYAHTKGCVAVAAAGNDNTDVMQFYPANIDTVIAVAASTQNDEKCSFSNWGSKIDVAAPGGGYINELGGGRDDIYNILSTMPDNSGIANEKPNLKVSSGYWRLAGTSMACPHVSGVAALILSRYPQLTNEEVRQKIRTTTDDIGQPAKDDYFGYGRVNAYNALVADIGFSLPIDKGFVHSQAQIKGAASMIEGFGRYELWYTFLDGPEEQNPTKIYESDTAVEGPNGILGIWDTMGREEGRYLLTLKIIRSDNEEIRHSIIVTVDNLNQPPEFKNLTNKIAVVDRMNSFKIEASDPDDPATPWGQLRYSASNLPLGALFNPLTKTLSWWPTQLNKGIYEVTFTVKDNEHTRTQKINLSTLVVQKTRITTGPSFEEEPAIYDNKIVWTDWRNKDYNNNYIPDVYLYDIVKKEEMAITNDPYYQGPPAIYGDKIAWEDNRNGRLDIYMYDLSIEQEFQITSESSDQQKPAIYGDRIVWEDYRNGENADIYMYDISAQREFQITDTPISEYHPAIYGDRIVWESYSNEDFDIFMYDLTTGDKIQITHDPNWQIYPAIYDDKIVWVDLRNGNFDIYMYDISTGKETPIITDAKWQGPPAIYDDKIVWIENRDELGIDHDIRLYDLSTGEEAWITTSPTTTISPAFYANKIVFGAMDSYPNDSDLYMIKFFFVPQITSVEPAMVEPNSFITITGKNFGYDKEKARVRFANGVDAHVESWTNTQITCRVPQNARSGLVKVITPGGNSNGVLVRAKIFPHITSIFPTSGRVGAYLYIYGQDLGLRDSISRVNFYGSGGSANASIVSWTNYYILCRVPQLPAGAYNVKVINNSGESNSLIFNGRGRF